MEIIDHSLPWLEFDPDPDTAARIRAHLPQPARASTDDVLRETETALRLALATDEVT